VHVSRPAQTAPVKKADIFRYLEARFAFEPLPHYPMIAVELCGEEEPLPPWVREFLTLLKNFFFEERDERTRIKPKGVFPSFTTQQDGADDQWARAEDCILFLEDEQAALAYQAHRLRLVTAYQRRLGHKASQLDVRQSLAVEIEAEYEDRGEEPPFNISEYAIERRWKAIVGQRSGFEDDVPVALTAEGEIAFLTPDGEIVRR
jgi:hypothetical protein